MESFQSFHRSIFWGRCFAGSNLLPERSERNLKNNCYPSGLTGCVGTGSTPPAWKGWHRSILLIESHTPLPGPYRATASYAYTEQVGWNRHPGPNSGDIPNWYALMNCRNMFLSIKISRFFWKCFPEMQPFLSRISPPPLFWRWVEYPSSLSYGAGFAESTLWHTVWSYFALLPFLPFSIPLSQGVFFQIVPYRM